MYWYHELNFSLHCLFFFFFFFSSRRRHTRSLRDWSSDVCSSDLAPRRVTLNARVRAAAEWVDLVIPIQGAERPAYFVEEQARALRLTLYNTRAKDRKSVV